MAAARRVLSFIRGFFIFHFPFFFGGFAATQFEEREKFSAGEEEEEGDRVP